MTHPGVFLCLLMLMPSVYSAQSDICAQVASPDCIKEFAKFTTNITTETATLIFDFGKLILNPLNLLNQMLGTQKEKMDKATLELLAGTIVQTVKTSRNILKSKDFQEVSRNMLSALLKETSLNLKFSQELRQNQLVRKVINLTTNYIRRCTPTVKSMMATLNMLRFQERVGFKILRYGLWFVDKCTENCEGDKCEDPWYCDFATKLGITVTNRASEYFETKS